MTVKTFKFALLALAVTASSAFAAPIVTMQQSNQGAFQVLDFFYSASDADAEFTTYEIDVQCTGAGCIADPNRGATSGTTQWDSFADSAFRLDTWANTVFSLLYDSPASYVFTNYKPNPPGQTALPASRLTWTVFDTDTGDTNTAEPTVDTAPYHLTRILTTPGSSGTVSYRAFDNETEAGATIPFVFGGPPPNVAPIITSDAPDALGQIQTSNGQVITHDFDVVDPDDVNHDWTATLGSFVPAYPGGVNNSAAATINDTNGTFSWNTLGAARGQYSYSIVANDGDVNSNILPYGVTITVVPEPSTLALFGLAMVGLVGLRRRNG